VGKCEHRDFSIRAIRVIRGCPLLRCSFVCLVYFVVEILSFNICHSVRVLEMFKMLIVLIDDFQLAFAHTKLTW